MIRGILVYTLYYTICIYGPLDLAKNEILRRNVKMGGYFLCLLVSFQTLVQAMIFDNIIYLLVPHKDMSKEWFILKVLDVLTTLFSIVCMSNMVKKELKELKSI